VGSREEFVQKPDGNISNAAVPPDMKRCGFSAVRFTISISALLLMATLLSAAREEPGQALPNFLKGNEQFGRKLLLQVYAKTPDRNIVIAPISLTFVFAALQTGLQYRPPGDEIGEAFGWGRYARLHVPARMLLAAFEKPEPVTPPKKQTVKSYAKRHAGAWIKNMIVYRDAGKESISKNFLENAEKYFGVKLKNVGVGRPSPADLNKPPDSLPKMSHSNDVLISSSAHLQTAWSGNTFSISKPYQWGFQTASGQSKQVETLNSEMKRYPYAKTDAFEAVVLPCDDAYMLAVLPAPGRSVRELIHALVDAPDAVDNALKSQLGTVAMPTFHFQFEANLRPQIEEVGIRQVFNDLDPIIRILQSHLTEVNQKTELEVDKHGIRASAETVAGAIYGGIGSATDAFRMQLNRPFIFFIRDQTTNALLFVGVVADPTQTESFLRDPTAH
jgi:hypothetical protein